jgi:adenylosuccinate lyase
MTNENILSKRYVTPSINKIFSEAGKTLAERELWIAVLKAQKSLNLQGITEEIILKYETGKNDLNLTRINEIEKVTKHDIKAKIQGFNEASNIQGSEEQIHRGLTSRDLTDNVEQYQILKASKIIMQKHTSILNILLELAEKYKDTYVVGRTHHQPAQVTTFGKRLSIIAEELLYHIKGFDFFLENYPLRGIKGPVGTQTDMLSLLGEGSKVNELEHQIAQHLGFKKILNSTSQIYPRSLDLDLISRLAGLSAASENLANIIRLMAGYNHLTEGFKKGQVGSTAMPHKQNAIKSERINGFGNVLKGYLAMASTQAGNQWEEGDVSCSVIRRVYLPDCFYTIDGQSETVLTVLNGIGLFPKVIENEVSKWLPFLASTKFLTLLTDKGVGREEAHKLIKDYAIEEALSMREGNENELLEKLSENQILKEKGISLKELEDLMANKEVLIGLSHKQILNVKNNAEPYLVKYGRDYQVGSIL